LSPKYEPFSEPLHISAKKLFSMVTRIENTVTQLEDTFRQKLPGNTRKRSAVRHQQRENGFFIDNLLVRIYFII